MKTENKIILGFFLSSFLYLWTIVSIMIGVGQEREHAICVKPYQIQQWRTTIDLTKGVYASVSDTYSAELKKADDEAEKWRSYYLWCKSQAEEKEEE